MTPLENHFMPKGWLKNPHVQGIVSRLPHRKKKILLKGRAMLEATRPMLLHGEEADLLAFYSAHAEKKPLVTLLHGWEGSSDSLYILATATELFNHGFNVLRINLRDHGESHHLNRELFHSCRDREVTLALQNALERLDYPDTSLAGFSLGGNFALRIALNAPHAIRQVFAVCPVISPPDTLHALEHGPALYRHYFMKRWRGSLKQKQTVQPEFFTEKQWMEKPNLTALTEHFVLAHTSFGSLENYLNGYRLSSERLQSLQVDSEVIIAEDDPVIPAKHWRDLKRNAKLRLSVVPYGGHCGFITDWKGTGWIEAYLTQRIKEGLNGSSPEGL